MGWVILTLSRVRLYWGMHPADPCVGGSPSSDGLNFYKQDGWIVTITIRPLQNWPGPNIWGLIT
jgi:hypothetical protein